VDIEGIFKQATRCACAKQLMTCQRGFVVHRPFDEFGFFVIVCHKRYSLSGWSKAGLHIVVFTEFVHKKTSQRADSAAFYISMCFKI
jgi:hypothetical protein